MAKKLVFDRTLWIKGSRSRITVPDGEVWKLGHGRCPGNDMVLVEGFFNTQGQINRIIGGGSVIDLPNGSVFTGIAFKIVEE